MAKLTPNCQILAKNCIVLFAFRGRCYLLIVRTQHKLSKAVPKCSTYYGIRGPDCAMLGKQKESNPTKLVSLDDLGSITEISAT